MMPLVERLVKANNSVSCLVRFHTLIKGRRHVIETRVGNTGLSSAFLTSFRPLTGASSEEKALAHLLLERLLDLGEVGHEIIRSQLGYRILRIHIELHSLLITQNL